MHGRKPQIYPKSGGRTSSQTGFARARLRSLYTTLAPLYDTLVPAVSSTARAIGLAWLNVSDGERVLDVGTGTGLALPALCRPNTTGWTDGVDITPAMLSRARRRLSDIAHARYRLQVGTAASLPYPENTFDAVYSSYLVDVLPASVLSTALQEMHRVLRPHGRLVLVYFTHPETVFHRIWSNVARVAPFLIGDARPIDARPALYRSSFDIHDTTTRTQAALRSAIVYSTPR